MQKLSCRYVGIVLMFTLTTAYLARASQEIKSDNLQRLLTGIPKAEDISVTSIQALLEQGVDVNTKLTNNNVTLLHLAAQSNKVECIKLLLEKGACQLPAGLQEETPLHVAAKKGYHEGVTLLAQNQNILDCQCKDGNTALLLAVKKQSIPCVNRLLERKANMELCENKNHMSALHRAAEQNASAIARMLIEAGAEIHQKTKGGGTPLTIAILNDALECCSLLLEAGATLDCSTRSKFGLTILHIAAGNGRGACIPRILQEYRHRLINEQDQEGLTAAHIAVHHGMRGAYTSRVKFLKTLVEAKPDLALCDKRGLTPLHLAAANGHHEMVQMLVDAKAPLEARDQDGRTPLFQAVECNFDVGDWRYKLGVKIEDRVSCVRILLDAGAEIDTRNSNGDTPLMCLVVGWVSGAAPLAALLIERGADKKAKNIRNVTPYDIVPYKADWILLELFRERERNCVIQ